MVEIETMESTGYSHDRMKSMELESLDGRTNGKDVTLCILEQEVVEDEQIIKDRAACNLLYGVDETPNWPTLIILILQNFLMMLSGIIGIPLLLAGLVCMRSDIEAYAHLISSTFVIQGVVTLAQSTIGIRLPVVQGASFSFIPAISSLATARGGCPSANGTTSDMSEVWGPRIAEVNGGLLIASIFQVILGFTGLSGWILRFVGPLSIAPCIGLLGLALIDATWPSCKVHWGISLLTIFFVVLFSQYLKNINVCSSRCNKKTTPHFSGKIFQLFPVSLSELYPLTGTSDVLKKLIWVLAAEKIHVLLSFRYTLQLTMEVLYQSIGSI